MSHVLETVTVVSDNGPLVINESDFDADTMELFEAPNVELSELDEALNRIKGLKSAELKEALAEVDADTEGTVPVLKARLSALATEHFEDEESN